MQFAVPVYRCLHRRPGTGEAQEISNFVGKGRFAATDTIHKPQGWFFKHIPERHRMFGA